MKAAVLCIIGLVGSWGHAAAESQVEGRVRLGSGVPVPGAQVLLFDLADLRAAPLAATTDRSGQFTLPLATLGGALPEQFQLGANYPNPFNPSTMIPYQLPVSMHVRLEVFNILGQRIATLVDGERPAGFHTASWDATDAAGEAVAAGVYLYRLSGDGVQATRSMLLIDGQAGIASGRGGSSGPDGEAGAGEDGEAAPVYGLAVSGPGLVAYVDPAFRVQAGMAPLDLVVEAPGRVPPAKAASSGGILGDVDNTGDVDFFDALLVALYSHDSSTVMPNNGDISLGDVDADGQVDLSDAWAIAAYLNDPSDPSLPAGIGEPVRAATASLSPDPSTVTFADDGAWHRFTVAVGEPVSVVANPEGTPRRLEITTRSGRGNYCPAEPDDDQSRQDGQTIYLSGCATGTATVELRREADGTVLRTYTFEVTGSPADLVVASVSVSDSTLTPGQSFTLSATVRNQGTAGADATTLRWYRSSNRTISTQDTRVGTNAVGALGPAGTSAESIRLTAPSSAGTYYYGACAVSVAGESAGNNCSTEIRVTVQSGSQAVAIPDANLRAAIEAALGKAKGATITKGEIKTLTTLEAWEAGIRDLTGLESATNLTVLDLRYNNISDVSPLAGLNNLTVLDLRYNNISDVSPLAGLNNLTRLYLWNNNISDVSPLAGLNNLTYLGLHLNNISDVSPLAGLNNLTDLGLNANNISDVSPLAGLNNLTYLGLDLNNISDVSPLAGLNNLKVLYLSANSNIILDVSPLAGLNNLTGLYLWNNNISDVSPLAGLNNLTSLELRYNNISDVSPLAGLNNLTSLGLHGNNISDVSPLAGLNNLTYLGLDLNNISDVSPLAGLNNLTELYLFGNGIADLSPLVANRGLAQDAKVDVRGNPLSASSHSTHLPALQRRGVEVLFDPDPDSVEEYDAPTLVAQHDDRVVVMGVPGRLRTDRIDFEALARVFFAHYEDAFDYLMVFSNLTESELLDHIYDYGGAHYSVQNDVEGTGKKMYSENQEWGSAGRLNAILHFPWNGALLSGPSLHEIMHSWANHAIPAPVWCGSHWAFSSANGQLGGFDRANLVDHGGGRYSAGTFGISHNGANFVPYSPIELYFAGLIPPSEVPELWVAEDGTWLKDASGNPVYGDSGPIFTASKVSTWSIERIVAEHGARIPDSNQSQKEFRAALILVVDPLHPARQSTLNDLSEAVQQFTHAGKDEHWGYNFWEATGGRATLTMDGLSAYRRPGGAGKRVAASYRVVEPEANHDGSIGCILKDDVVWSGQRMVAPPDSGNQ